MRLLDPLFTTDALGRVFSDRGRLQGMLDFEAALARAQGRAGVIPAPAAAAIEGQCRAELYDLEELGRAAASAGNLAIPLVRALAARVGPEAARWVHHQATSQDAIDTGAMLQLRDALRLIDADLVRIAAALARLAAAYKRTVMVGRTWLMQAEPTTFGLKAAGWLDAIRRDRARLRALAPAVQLGGPVGTHAADDIAPAMASDLGLALPRLPWHAHRDRPAEAAAALGIAVGTLGKIARDLSLLGQTEVAEAFEPAAPGRGGSSAMPHKQNPVGAAVVLAAAQRVPPLVSTMLSAMVQEHERGLGGWHAEWETLPEICALAGGAAAHLAHVLEGLRVDAARMRANLEATGGQIYAGAVAAALEGAHGRVEEACRRAAAEKRHLRDVIAEEFPDLALDQLFDPTERIGAVEALVDRVLTDPEDGT